MVRAKVDYDLVVVGSGPAGATAARTAVRGGLSVLLVDKKQELGAPIQCSGAVSANALAGVDVAPAAEFVLEPVYGFVAYDAEGTAETLDYRRYRDQPLGYVVDRRRFDRHLAGLAEQAGAELWLKTEAVGHEPRPDGTTEVRLTRLGRPVSVTAHVVVGADGVQSQVGRWAGIQTRIKLKELASCFQFVVEGVETRGLLEIVTGERWAPGGYAWIFPKGHGNAEVGLGVARTMTERDARWHLDRFMTESFLADRLKGARIIEVQGGGVPLAAPLKRQSADHIVLVGDAARHVNPITGGGIHTALRGGAIAGGFLAEFLAGDLPPTAAHLDGYHQRWLAELGNTMWKLYGVKTGIFRERDAARRDALLNETMTNYFRPDSEFRKV
ncbi:geranylgeranyl reductase family protein [Kitasatospora viridis]|uniref:2,3-di-O-geranylgeranylglyceryl phosphate reductase n=1 Tax=Kitasatospora viridis TaxID=281105 RepID=A0A561SDK9_9ACTN|nr:NAD(P)/FAD-dependent oxidoreductase [Kitasatospora viridis]TWF72956.1 2,3-di-O-geranylgeranylglyceryl phosphate reductase [Kitasatospora viridis]